MNHLLIVGLGNPGNNYALTRHNIGYMVVDKLASQCGTGKYKVERGICEHTTISIEGTKVYLMKPLTFMNNSGQAVNWIQTFYKIPTEDILVIYDDIAIAFGLLRLRKNGSAGGHNGLKSIIEHIGQDFARLRLGILPEHPVGNLANFVLDNFNKTELQQVKATLDLMPEVISCLLKEGFDKAMNKYN